MRSLLVPLFSVMATALLASAGCSDATVPAGAADATVHDVTAPSGETATPGATTVGRYAVLELTFDHASAGLANPWEAVEVSVTFTTPTRTLRVGGFYYEANTWKARVAPDELGEWTWRATIVDGGATTDATGSFRVTDTGEAGFVRKNASDPFAFVTSNGAPYVPLGLGDCINDGDGDGDPFDFLGFDGDTVNDCADTNTCDTEATRTDLDTYIAAYAAGGFNFFRWSVDNCAFKLWQTIAPEGNRYLEREMKWGDTLVQTLRAGGFRVMMAIFGFEPPFAGGGHSGGAATPAQMEAVQRYARYVVDRFGAYVDLWEIMNEANAPAEYLTAVAGALRERDPYGHLISTSWERPELNAIEVNAPHWYETENELESDVRMAAKADEERARGKVVVFGEQGNWGSEHAPAGPWDPRSSTRMRIRSWVALMKEVTLVFWNQSCCPLVRMNGAANLYIGPEERGFMAVLRAFAETLTAGAEGLAGIEASGGLRGYGLSDGDAAWVYVVNGVSHTAPTSGGTVTLNVPTAGTATFVSTTTGGSLGTLAVAAGRVTLALPTFTTDIAVRVGP